MFGASYELDLPPRYSLNSDYFTTHGPLSIQCKASLGLESRPIQLGVRNEATSVRENG